MKPAIVLSSHTMGLSVIRALGIMGVPVVVVYYEKEDMGYVSKYVKEKIYSPHPEKYENEFVALLLELSKKLGRCLLVPTDDATLLVVSKHKRMLEDYYIVACTEWAITEKFIDKKRTYDIAKDIGIPHPKTMVPKSNEEVERFGKEVEYPCLIKPCLSHRYFEIFRKKMVKVNNFEQLLFAYRQAANAGFEVMLQEFIPGDDTQGVNYNSYFWVGKPIIEFTAEKVRLSPPHFGVPRVVISKDIQELMEPGRKILQAMDFYGFSCTEFKRDIRNGIYKLMEVNGRHNRSGLLALKCGINFPWIEYEHLINGKYSAKNNYRMGVYWIDEFRDIFHSAKYFGKEGCSFGGYFTPYLRQHIFAVFDLKDPKPFFKRVMDLLKKALWQFIQR